MSDVSFEIKKFIKSHIEQIEMEKYEDVYEDAYTDLSGDRIGELTTILERIVEYPEDVSDARDEVLCSYIDHHLKEFGKDYEHPITIPSFVRKYMYSTMGLSMSEFESLMVNHLDSFLDKFYIDQDDFTYDLLICYRGV